MKLRQLARLAAGASFAVVSVSVAAQQSVAPHASEADLVRQGQQQQRQGHLDAALSAYRQALAAAPDSYQANYQAGAVLDLLGRYDAARPRFQKAIDVAPTPQNKVSAQRGMAVSYGFTRDCKDAEKYEAQAYQYFLSVKDYYNVGEMADELARLCLEANDLDTAQSWYRKGHTQGLLQPDITPARKDLWAFRWESALARVAARRGRKEEAQKHVAAAKAILDRGTNPSQAPFFPYLTGYVAFYAGDYKTALADLQKGNQGDPFVLALIAQSYDALGGAANAKAAYEQIMTITVHNPTAAYARPIARKALGR
ncbi:MAG TPA: tetratricopeptide repeat protein [Vicinamibacterales bacterium]|nr:tetratricopeptide repeat protein [Vicinamibacterales bacterium]